ncbi:MAG: redoxin domain-containing protein [Nitrospirota bacterium]|nr:redoxin domain-containing protein [Nitrospirota bacterium]
MDDMLENRKGPVLGEPAPFFKTDKKEDGFGLEKLKGSWTILFSHPDDLLPIFKTRTIKYVLCKRKIKAVAIGSNLSPDTTSENNFLDKYVVKHSLAIIDDAGSKVAKSYGLDSSDETSSVKGVFVIDPQRKLRMKLFFSMDTERDFTEILKLVDALQDAEKQAKQKKQAAGTYGVKLKLNRLIMPNLTGKE